MSQFHESFWVAIAASTPVIGLAHSVAFERYYRIEQRIGRQLPSSRLTWHYLKAWFLRGTPVISEIFCVLAFWAALGSLSSRADASMSIIGALVILAFFGITLESTLLISIGEYDRPKPDNP